MFFKILPHKICAQITPSLIAIYSETDPVSQIGTGFFVSYESDNYFVTAKHVLYGHKDDEDPQSKRVFWKGSLCKLPWSVTHEDQHDLAVARIFEESIKTLYMAPTPHQNNLVTIYGYLARDFKRNISQEILSPAPFCYTNKKTTYRDGYLAFLSPKHKNRDSNNAQIVMAPIPSGLSGCPIFDSIEAFRGNILVSGIFTDYVAEKGIGFGEEISKLQSLIKKLPQQKYRR